VIHFRGHPIVIPKPAYSLTKACGTLALSMVADDIAANEMQIIIFHPGLVYGVEAEKDGIPEHGVFEFDDGKLILYHILPLPGGLLYWTWSSLGTANLPGAFAVWAASPEAKFLHGRYVYAAWDVEELAKPEIMERLEVDRNYLQVSVKGLKWGKKD
jgi:hypothetical protein